MHVGEEPMEECYHGSTYNFVSTPSAICLTKRSFYAWFLTSKAL